MSRRADITISVLIPPILFLLMFGVYTAAPDTYLSAFSKDLISEKEGVSEYIQVFLLFISIISAFIHYITQKRLGFLVWAFVCLIVFFEELSWGQQLIPIESPEFFEKFNRQGETNIHNFGNDLALHSVWIIAAIILIIGPFLSEKYFPPKYYILYFLPVVIFYTCFEFGRRLDVVEIGDHQEAAELFLYLGVAQWLTVSLILPHSD